MTKAVIFDLDGLLVDTEMIAYRIFKELAAAYGHEFSLQEYTQNYCGKMGMVNITNLINSYHLPFGPEEGMVMMREREKEIFAEGVKLKNGALELLRFLKEHGYKTAIATSSTNERASKILKEHGIENQFDAFVFADDIKRSKPFPDVFLKAAEKLAVEPEDCLVLEDSEAGIEASANAGIPVICIPDLKKPDADHLAKVAAVLTSLHDVIGYLADQQ